MSKTLSRKALLSYGILAMPVAFSGIPLYIHAPDFYATEYGVSLGSLGLVLLFLRFIDAVQDPVIGYYSDKYSKYRPVIISIGSISLGISFILLFRPLIGSYLIWFSIMNLLATSAFSILTINLNTLGGLWSKNKDQKTTIVGYREVLGLVGLILAVTLPSVLQNQISKQQTFLIVSIFLIFLLLVAGFIFNKWQSKHLDINNKKATINLGFKQLKNISNQAKKFYTIYILSMLASSIPAVLVLFFIRDRLGLESYTGIFLLTYFLSGAIGIVIWSVVSQRIGKHKTWFVGMLLAILSFVWAYFIQEGDFAFYLAICIMSGIAFGAELVLPSSILADHIQDSESEDNAAMHFGILAFLAKLALALAAATSFLYLENRGFVAGHDNTETALQALSLSYTLIPCLFKLISTYLLWRVIHEKNNGANNGGPDYA